VHLKDMQQIRESFVSRHSLLRSLADELEVKTKQALEDVPHIDRIAFRAKGVESFVAKAGKEKYPHPLRQLEDQVSGRVITFFRDDIAVVRDVLMTWFGDVEHEIKAPAIAQEFGYESEHFVFVIPDHMKSDEWQEIPDMPETFELQIRTLFMHAWAEPQHDLGYKGDPDPEVKRELAWIAASAWGADRTLNEVARKLSPQDLGELT